MNWKLAACLLGVVLLAGGFLFFVTGGRGGAGGRGEPTRGATPLEEASLTDADAELGASSATEAEAPATAVEGARAVAEVQVEPSGPADLAGLTGRVVESDGKPVAGIRVALLEFTGDLLFDGTTLDEKPTLELEETATDAEGRFLLGGARAQAFHGLGVDLGGPRATLRVLDHALEHRQRTDVGDVVLAPFGVLTGRVVDERGAPLAGARVRAGPFPAQILQAQPQDIRADSAFALSLLAVGGEGQRILELPGWVGTWIDRLPVPTTTSGADGRFRLEGVALAMIVGGVDLRGRVGATFGPLDLAGGSHELGDVVLQPGRTVRGVVEDSSGDAVAGAEVVAGAELVPGIFAVLQPCGPSDEDGNFELSGVPASGQIVAAARRARHEPWRSVTGARHEGVLIELESTVQLLVNVRDEAGEPLSGADLRLEPILTTKARGEMGQVLAFLPRPASQRLLVSEFEPGRYRIAELGAGLYQATARVAGLAPGVAEVECVASENEVTLTCGAGRRLELLVIATGTKDPIRGARASVLRTGSTGFLKLGSAETDAEGRAWLGPLPELPPARARDASPFEDQALLRVQHARFGDYSGALDPSVSPLVIALHAGGTLTGRVHWGGEVPTQIYMLTLESNDNDGLLGLFRLPRFGVTGLTGTFRLANLEPGEYRVSLSERFLDEDPLGMMAAEIDPVTLWRGTVTIEDGQTAELEIDLTPTGRGVTASVAGRVRFDGSPLEGATVSVNGNESLKVQTDAWGRFETPTFSVLGSVSVRVNGAVPLGGGERQELELYSESIELEQDEVHALELDLYPLRLRARVVVDASSEPIPGAKVTAEIQRGDDRRRVQTNPSPANSSGEVELLVLEPGEYHLTASATGFGRATAEAKVPAEGQAELVTLRLPRAVPCAGRVDAAPADVGPIQFSFLRVEAVDGSASSGTRLQPPEYTFKLEGLTPGEYKANLFLGGQDGEEVSFQLGPEGDEQLVLPFTPSTN